ncbi:TPA: hypothetical protein MFM57_001870 [Klebsiella pneumoniae]|nr:hypothetical protein [Klebsiella pneumoniae]HBW8922305.1 hypothetical protein [Klebsiella pneumoniae subsp. pneumoniae 1158]HBW8561940.1 hypothetical protein [Klebsiella pneumoniae]HBW8604232.1 hypothetical protein [Klebsiella pneumoniae]HBW8696698.1 hypothetical protein [Klebsiella pneumoniae]
MAAGTMLAHNPPSRRRHLSPTLIAKAWPVQAMCFTLRAAKFVLTNE